MNNFKPIYSNRFSPSYLHDLALHLQDIEHLKKTALYEEKEIGGVTYTRCISIDFCGISASTLLFPNLDHPDVDGIKPNRREVAKAFRDLFDQDLLLTLNGEKSDTNADKNKERFYLRVRFCFSYLYSDYPICLMKAEQKNVWKFQGDKPVDDFWVNKPLNNGELNNATIKDSQEHSLKGIIDILKDNEDLIILGGQEKKTNTIQVRFSVIPSPVCTLIINDTAYCDPYLYDKVKDDKQLSLVYPVNVFKAAINHPANENSKAFDGIRRHFNYLWRHDLTLFCSDATKFSPSYLDGLSEILPPNLVQGPDGTNWAHKERRIREKMRNIAQKEGRPPFFNESLIKEWRDNLNAKFKVCTRKIEEDLEHGDKGNNNFSRNMPAPGKQTRIKIGMKRRFFYFHIYFAEINKECEYLKKDSNLLYCLLAHYCYATLYGEKEKVKAIMIDWVNSKDQVKDQVTEMLSKCNLDNDGDELKMFKLLFTWPASQFKFNLSPEQIEFDFENKELIASARYPVRKDLKLSEAGAIEWISCLDFEPKNIVS